MDRPARENRKVAVPETRRRRGRGNSINGSGRLSGHEQTRPSSPPSRHDPLPTAADMLPALEPAFWRVVDDGLATLGTVIDRPVRAAIEAQVKLLLAWNTAINLTALRTPDAIARGHVLDSLSALPACRGLLERSATTASPVGLLDLGSGGGYPGLPLAIALGVQRAALVDSIGKKARFLATAAAAAMAAMQAAGVDPPLVAALAERAEDLADEPDQREAWQLVVARAVGSLAEVVELGLPLATIGGHVVAWKRDTADQPVAAEITAARRILQAAGGGRPTIVRPDAQGKAGLADHVLVIVRKVRSTPDRYPRATAERRRSALLG